MTENIERLLTNYLNARLSWEAWLFMNNADLLKPKPEIRNYVDSNKLLFHLRFLSMKDFHIELYKILKKSKNNKDNIFNLLEQLKQKKTKTSKVEKVLSKLIEHESTIKTILDTRDKFYAHLDEDYRDYLTTMNVEEILFIFIEIEKGIMLLTSKQTLVNRLNDLPSRNDFELCIGST